MFHCAGALRLDNSKFFRCPGGKVRSVFFFCLSKIDKEDSNSLNCLRRYVLSRMCWGVGAASSVLEFRVWVTFLFFAC